jgi:hypothetical protein
MLTIEIPNAALKRLEKAVRDSGRKLPQEVSVAVNATAKKLKTQISKDVRTELAAPAKAVNSKIANTRATRSNPSAVVSLSKSKRIPLKEFRANQTKKGVSYKVSKTQGRKRIESGFIVAAYGGNVYQRRTKARPVGARKYGPSPWGVFVKRGMTPAAVKFAQKELNKQLERRIKFNVLKASGAI